MPKTTQLLSTISRLSGFFVLFLAMPRGMRDLRSITEGWKVLAKKKLLGEKEKKTRQLMWNFDAHWIKVNLGIFYFSINAVFTEKNKQEPIARWGSDNLTEWGIFFINVWTLESNRPGFEFLLCHLLSVWWWESYFFSF